MRAYQPVLSGEDVFPEMQGYKMACCDCGLVHSLDFRIVKVTGKDGDLFHTDAPENEESLRVVMTATRDEVATKMMRAEAPGDE